MTTLTDNPRADIRRADDHFEALFARGDAAGMAALYTPDGVLLPPGAGLLTGPEAIAAFWQGAMDLGIKQARLEILEVDDQGDTAIETGRYTLSGADGQVLDRGKYVVIWKRHDGHWRLHRDIWNSSVPAEA